jgi:hypothetical protein
MVTRVGPHLIEIEGDTIIARPDGPFELEHLNALFPIIEKILAEQGRCFTISDLRKPTSFPAETRRRAIEWSKSHVVTGSVMFGTSLTARVTLTLMMRATELLTRRPAPLVAVSTEEEARAWVAARRRKLFPNASS